MSDRKKIAAMWVYFSLPAIYLALSAFTGCAPTKPAPGTYSPLVAASLGVASIEANPSPAPAPTPQPGVCSNCNGTGKLGDGTITVPCPVCGGDGRTDNALPEKPKPVDPFAVPTPAGESPTEHKAGPAGVQATPTAAYDSPANDTPRRGVFRRLRRGGFRSGGTSNGQNAATSC